ncbi:MAG: UvrB/UvrC motif-containing protein [Clostridium sp.]|nr:MAG: UvrB/UvrC motif-containing protein [Clostridium sp.]
MHACYAPCINKGVIDYTKDKEAVISFLNGNTDGVLKELTLKMEEASNNLEFERAMEFRDLINDIRKKLLKKQNISINDFFLQRTLLVFI